MNKYQAALMGGAASKIITEKLYQERISLYNKNPKLCKFCKKPLIYKKEKIFFVIILVLKALITLE